MNKLLISVVIPLYNKEKTIEQSLNSVLLQKGCEFEVVVVDDGSTDNSVEQVKKINNPKIKLVSQPNGGPGAARNTGAKAANGDWLVFLDADDKVKKLSYPASFGCKKWEYTKEQEKTCSRLAKRFDAISVREASAVDLCKNHFGVDAALVLDPTLLLNKEDYEKVCNDIPKKEKHIFVYSLVVGESVMNVASKVSEAKDLPIVVKEAGGKVKKEDTIEDWFAEFRDAEYVVTDSFHGMVFSIIFNKPFSIVMNPSGGNDRYISLLSQLGLMECIVDEKLTPSSAIIDWEQVCSLLNVLRESSLLFLKQNLR